MALQRLSQALGGTRLPPGAKKGMEKRFEWRVSRCGSRTAGEIDSRSTRLLKDTVHAAVAVCGPLRASAAKSRVWPLTEISARSICFGW